MASMFKTVSAITVSGISFGLLVSNAVLAGAIHVQEASSVHVQEASSVHIQEAGAIHVQEAESQLLESAGMETVVIDGEVAHVF